MCKSSQLHAFLHALPKCEHHLHLEGCLSPTLLFALSAKNNIPIPSDPSYASIATLTERYNNFSNLNDFLAFYYRALDVVVSVDDFEMLGWEYFTIANRDGVKHAEVFFDPQSHTSRGVSLETVVSGFDRACKRAEKELGITSKLIMCFLRHLPVQEARVTMDEAVKGGYFDGEESVISALGLDSSEVGFRPEIFQEMYVEAEKRGIRRTAHAGEEGDPTYISGALDGLHAERIDHGIRLIEDADLMDRVIKEGIMLTVCPLSNVCLQVVQHVGQLPIRKFLEAGVKFSLNSDDPAYFGGYILNNYCAVQDAFDLSIAEWKTIVENSIQGSWCDQARKDELLTMLKECLSEHAAS
ncbi:adenosine deaminase [Ophiobolus disseminans]|uniref:Adenine deaminase n=1 Tax=Ophiobolus disseminans TaxID=1469910 RepID=A0A6A7AFA7_9PLEO|nr:adenosine deaminase [Ophiobolus disseminans]